MVGSECRLQRMFGDSKYDTRMFQEKIKRV